MLHAETRTLCAALRVWGDDLTVPPPSVGSAATEAEADETLATLVQQTDGLRARLAEKEQQAVTQRFIEAAPQALVGTIELEWAKREAEPPTAVPPSTDPEAREVTLVEVIELLSKISDLELRSTWLAAAYRDAQTDESARRLAALAREVRGHLVGERRRAAFRERCERVSVDIVDIDSTAASAARAVLRDAKDESDLADGVVLARTAREEWESDAARRHVITQTAAVLAELGHGIEEGFVVDALGGDFVVAATDDARYGLQLRFTESRDLLLTNTVALAETDAVSDRQAEEAECDALDELRHRLSASRIDLTRVHAMAPGAVAVERRQRNDERSEAEERRRRRSERTAR